MNDAPVQMPSADQLVNLAVSAALEARWSTAIQLNRDILKDDPTNLDALNRLGHALSELGLKSQAEQTFKKVIKLDRYNTIAAKGIERLKLLKRRSPTETPDAALPGPDLPSLFLEEYGKTITVSLGSLASPKTLSGLNCGDLLFLKPKKHQISVTDRNNIYLGKLPDILAMRLLRLLKGGNRYIAYTKSVERHHLKIFIRETQRAKRLEHMTSFPQDENGNPYGLIADSSSAGQPDNYASEEAASDEDSADEGLPGE
jgi:hypothetical protein